jgi:hypothetical protein
MWRCLCAVSRMNKKGQTLLIVAIMIIAALILYIVVSNNKNGSSSSGIDLTFQEGSSTDYVYTIEQGKISGWNKLYLKDDHKTIYCFDNPTYIDMLKTAQEKNIKVTVYYREYLIKGMLCGAPTGVDSVVAYNIELKE